MFSSRKRQIPSCEIIQFYSFRWHSVLIASWSNKHKIIEENEPFPMKSIRRPRGPLYINQLFITLYSGIFLFIFLFARLIIFCQLLLCGLAVLVPGCTDKPLSYFVLSMCALHKNRITVVNCVTHSDKPQV